MVKTNRRGTNAAREFHESQYHYFRNEFDMKVQLLPCNQRRNIVVNITPDLLTNVKHINDYIDNYYIA